MTTEHRLTAPDDTLSIALSLVKHGWHLFPVAITEHTDKNGSTTRDKRPLIKWGDGASSDPETVATWWSGVYAGSWIGVHAERSGLVVIDVDKHGGKDGFASLKAAGIVLPKTLHYKTRGGKHYVFKAPDGERLTIGQDVKAPDGRALVGVDVRAGTGLMVYYGPELTEAPKLADPPRWACLPAMGTSQKTGAKVDEWLERVIDGKPGKALKARLATVKSEGMSHDDMLALISDLVERGNHGAPGVAKVLDRARSIYLANYPKHARQWDEALAGSIEHYGYPPTRIAKPTAPEPLPEGKKRKKVKPRDIEDSPLAVEIANSFQGRWAWTESLGLIRWLGTHWEKSTETSLIEAVRDALVEIENQEHDLARERGEGAAVYTKLRMLLSVAKARNVMLFVKGILAENPATPDAYPDLINTPSGIVDLATGELYPHDPQYAFTKITGAAYDPEASSTDWGKALEAVPHKVRDWLQVRIGQAATGHMTPDDLLPLLSGAGENGKSTVLDAVRQALGDFAVTVPERLLLSNPGDHPTELTTLMGARLAVIEELPEGRNLNVKRLKDVVGTPVITARRVRQDNVSWRATHSLLLSTNYLPIVAESDHGTWRRLALVTFPYRFVAEGVPTKSNERAGDRGLRLRLGNPDAGVLAWIVEGARKWYAAQKAMPTMPKAVTRDTQGWREDADPVMAFIEEHIIRDTSKAIPSSELAEAFNVMLAEQGHHEWSMQTINARFGAHEAFTGVTRKRVRFVPLKLEPSRYTKPGLMLNVKPLTPGTPCWVGVRFRDQFAEPLVELATDRVDVDG